MMEDNRNEFDETKVVLVPEENQFKTNYVAFTPLVVSIVGFISVFCTTVLGWKPFPFTGEEVAQSLSFLLTGIGTVWSWWKNNDATKKAQQRTAVADQVAPKEKKKALK